MAASSGSQNFGNPNWTISDTSFTATELASSTTYYFIVRAEDAAGNEDTNAVQRSGSPSDERPELTVTTPPDGVLTNVTPLVVAGNTWTNYDLTVGGAVVEQDPQTGDFTAEVALAAGANTIAVVSSDPETGASSSQSIAVTYQPDSSGFAAAAVGGTAFTATVTAQFPLTVRLADGDGTPVYYASASFRIASSPTGAQGAALSGASSRTAANGTAAATFTAGNKAGEYTVACDIVDAAGDPVSGSPVTFQFTAAADILHLATGDDLTQTPGGEEDKDSKGRETVLLVDGLERTCISYTDTAAAPVKADGNEFVEIAVTVYDIYGNTVSDVAVSLTATPVSGAARNASRTAAAISMIEMDGESDAQGIALFKLVTLYEGEFEVQLQVGGADFGPEFMVVFQAPTLALSDVHTYPNPWSPHISPLLCFAGSLTTSVPLTIEIFDVRGSKVRDLAGAADVGDLAPDGVQQSLLCWDGTNNSGRLLANGVYLYYLNAWGDTRIDLTGKFSVAK